MPNKKLIVVAGPTGIGKTAYAIQLAKSHSAEIISADSRQIYKEMTVGTAKPSPEERAEVQHHFIDVVSVTEDYSAGRYEEAVIAFLEKYFAEKDTAILCGGTGLYIDAVLYGLDAFPDIPPAVLRQLDADLENNGLEMLVEELRQKDPAYYEFVDRRNHRRILRALSVIRHTDRAFSSYRSNSRAERFFDVEAVILERDRDQLYDRINRRVDRMMSNGLLEEVRSLLPHRSLKALQTVGYAEIFDHLEGHTSLDEAVDLIKRNSRRYAKRQMTWLRKKEWEKIVLAD